MVRMLKQLSFEIKKWFLHQFPSFCNHPWKSHVQSYRNVYCKMCGMRIGYINSRGNFEKLKKAEKIRG